MPSKMYSPTSSVLDTLDRQVRSQMIQPYQNQHPISQTFGSSQCLKFRYFSIFLICTTCLALLSASLATHKWIISKPIRMLKLNSSHTNWTSLMLIASQNDSPNSAYLSLSHREPESMRHNSNSLVPTFGIDSSNSQANDLSGSPMVTLSNSEAQTSGQSKKFQGEIYFGLFKGLKVLNHGFGDRQSLISVTAPFHRDQIQQPHEIVNFRLWLLTLTSVSLAMLFALIGSIFAIINFVMSPRGTLTGPVGLVIWNATACFACLIAIVSWLVEFLIHLQVNVLTPEEVHNGWTSESRSHFGYSYYLVVSAFILHLVNIFIISIVRFESWTKGKASSKRQARPVCEGVTMLY